MKRAPMLAAGAVLLAAATPAAAQEPDTLQVDSVVIESDVAAVPAQDTVLPISPRGAWIRSMILPGWGQSYFESYVRGGAYFAGWAGNWLALFKTVTQLENAQARFKLRKDQLVAGMLASTTNPDSLDAVLDTTDLLDTVVRADSAADDLRKLVRARKQQREDWVAWSIFWLLASGIDAYVTAHLATFPAAIQLEPAADRSVTLRFEVPLGRRRP